MLDHRLRRMIAPVGDKRCRLTLTIPSKDAFSADNKRRAAEEITRIHNEVTRAATFFAQVLFIELEPENYFVAGKPLRGDQVFLDGQIRAGRSAIDRTS